MVSMLFCGTSEDPLLVQRIGRNREAAARAEEAAPTGAGALSGAAAAPSLGYAQRGRSASERLLVEAAEQAMARLWQGGKTVALPLPPPGFQWEIGGEVGREEEAERAVPLSLALTPTQTLTLTLTLTLALTLALALALNLTPTPNR